MIPVRFVPVQNISWNSGIGFELEPGDGPAQITSGFGSIWETLSRPQKKAIVRFVGQDPIGIDVPVFFDGFPEGRSIESQLDTLIWSALPKEGDEGMYPGTVFRVFGPIPFPGKRYVIADIEWPADGTIISDNGHIQRQAAVLKLIEYVPADGAKVKRKRRLAIGSFRQNTIEVITDKETWRSLAARYGGSAKEWAKANGNKPRDVAKKLKKGRTVRVP